MSVLSRPRISVSRIETIRPRRSDRLQRAQVRRWFSGAPGAIAHSPLHAARPSEPQTIRIAMPSLQIPDTLAHGYRPRDCWRRTEDERAPRQNGVRRCCRGFGNNRGGIYSVLENRSDGLGARVPEQRGPRRMIDPPPWMTRYSEFEAGRLKILRLTASGSQGRRRRRSGCETDQAFRRRAAVIVSQRTRGSSCPQRSWTRTSPAFALRSQPDKPALLRSSVRPSIVACVLVHIAPALKRGSVTCDRMDRDNRLSKNL